jgi:hypothetical protein
MPARDPAPQPASIHQLKITLRGLKPPIWRRVAVPSDMALGDLRHVILIAMGWGDDEHLHDFRVDTMHYGDPDLLDMIDHDEWETHLADVAAMARKKFRYLYDFGDSWEHEILVERVGPPEPGTRYPRVVAGKRACPPEDCGGVWAYARLLEIMADPSDPAYEARMEWLGGPIDPEAFDLEAADERLQESLAWIFRRSGGWPFM